jgi:DNA repair exonuclease SbcCD nuclease subunit
MHFIHCGDTHLGRSNFRLDEREQDFFKAFEKVVDTAIKREVDFIVHSGDLFDMGKPSVSTVIRCVKQLKKLKRAGIPVFVVWGSHDVSLTESPVQLLDELGLTVNLADKRYHEVGEKVKLSGESIKDCFICGIPGRRANAKAMYEGLEVEPRGKYNIFIFHHTISEADNITSDIPISLLPKGFDYYAGGHWHKRCEFVYGKGIVVYPGSTEFNTVDEMDEERGFYIVDTDGSKEWIKTNQRDAIVRELKIDCSDKEANERCIELLPEKGNGEIFIIRLKGRLASGTKGSIDRRMIDSIAKDRGFLTAKTYISQLANPESRVHVQTKKRSLEEIEKEFLEKSGYGEKVVDLAVNLIKVLGGEMSPSEKEKAVGQAEKLVRESL